MKNATVAAGAAPAVRCRICKREIAPSRTGSWIHTEIQAVSPHLAEPAPADLRRYRDWQRSRVAAR